VRQITAGEGLPVVYDGVGAPTFEQSLLSLRRRGTLVSYGSAGGVPAPLEIFRLNRLGSLYLTSAGLADYIRDRAEMLERAHDLFAIIKTGAVRVSVRQRYPLAEAQRAHRDLEARRTIGSSVLLP
jgi:NADPH2:quinone reductase